MALALSALSKPFFPGLNLVRLNQVFPALLMVHVHLLIARHYFQIMLCLRLSLMVEKLIRLANKFFIRALFFSHEHALFKKGI